MKRAKKNDNGRRPKRGLTPGQAGAVFIAVLAAILAMTMHVNSQWTGMSIGEQLHQALFVATDLD